MSAEIFECYPNDILYETFFNQWWHNMHNIMQNTNLIFYSFYVKQSRQLEVEDIK